MALIEVCTAANDCDIYEDTETGDMVLMSVDKKNIIRITPREFAGFGENIAGYLDERRYKSQGAAKYYRES